MNNKTNSTPAELQRTSEPSPISQGILSDVRRSDDQVTTGVTYDHPSHRLAEMRHDKDAIRRIFETGEYPYKRKISRKTYEKQKAELQVELLKVQDWVKQTGQKLVLIFEGAMRPEKVVRLNVSPNT